MQSGAELFQGLFCGQLPRVFPRGRFSRSVLLVIDYHISVVANLNIRWIGLLLQDTLQVPACGGTGGASDHCRPFVLLGRD